MAISFKDKIEEVQGKQLQKVLNSNLSNIPKACKKMGFTPLKEINGVHVANKGKVFDSIIVGSANSKTYAVMVRKGGDFLPITDPEDAISAFLEEGFSEDMNKSQKVLAVASKIAELIA
ncbi:MAG: hypothetical protein L3J43_00675 [Sulfurovum sp.]|nr:hypothetical protein [Sulfurovum sp.]